MAMAMAMAGDMATANGDSCLLMSPQETHEWMQFILEETPGEVYARQEWERERERERERKKRQVRRRESRPRCARFPSEPTPMGRRSLRPGLHHWQTGYLDDPMVRVPTSSKAQLFRSEFGVPFEVYEALLQRASSEPKFTLAPMDGERGRPPAHPLRTKILAILFHLAKGVKISALEASACISQSTLRKFVAEFSEWYSETIYPEVVRLPSGEHLQSTMECYRKLGFPGCVAIVPRRASGGTSQLSACDERANSVRVQGS